MSRIQSSPHVTGLPKIGGLLVTALVLLAFLLWPSPIVAQEPVWIPDTAVTPQPFAGSQESRIAEPKSQFSQGLALTSWARYTDSKLGISFEYPDTWAVTEVAYPDENYRALEISEPTGGLIVIERESNQEQLDPRQWFEKNGGRRYHSDLATKIADMELRGNPVLIISEPKTAKSVPMVTAIIQRGDAIFLAFQLERGSRTSAAELGRLLETLSFGGEEAATTPIDANYLKFPLLATEGAGSPGPIRTSAASASAPSARICPRADVYIPTEGNFQLPWGCIDSSYCTPYKTNNPKGCGNYDIFCKPHSGIDIFGGQGLNKTPVYAPYSGIARRIGDSAVRVNFDAPRTSQSGYLTHMATGTVNTSTYLDFRNPDITSNSPVVAGVTWIGNQGDYGTSPVHLHFSLSDNNTDLWPTLDPTDFLKAKHLAFDQQWHYPGQPIACMDSDWGDTTTVTDIPNPDSYRCSQPGHVDFEGFPDGTDLISGTISGLQFMTTGGFTWVVGDWATGNYGGKYPSGGYTSGGTRWAWLGSNQGAGRIEFPKGPASVFSLLVSADTLVSLDAYDKYDNLLATAGSAPSTYGTGHMIELKITRAMADMDHVVVHTTGNYFLVDDVCTNAAQTPNTIKRIADQTYPMQTGQSVSGSFIVDLFEGFRSFLHIFVGPFHSDVDLRLTRPDGSQIQSGDPGVTFNKTSTLVEVFIDDAAVGEWGYEIVANELDPGGESIRIRIDEEALNVPRKIFLPLIRRAGG